jgi:hypothetical protein
MACCQDSSTLRIRFKYWHVHQVMNLIYAMKSYILHKAMLESNMASFFADMRYLEIDAGN